MDMMPQKKPMMPPQAGAAPPAGGPPPQAAPAPQMMPPGAGAGAPAGMPPQQPMVSGEEVQGLLFSRIQQFDERDMQLLDDIITMENMPMLLKLLPELAILFEKGTNIQSAQGQAPGGGSESTYSNESGEPSQNPLVNAPDSNSGSKPSRGLMGY